MSFQQLETRLSRIAANTPEKVNPESEAAFKAIITYLDGLAARKAAGDPEAQMEIEMAAKALRK